MSKHRVRRYIKGLDLLLRIFARLVLRAVGLVVAIPCYAAVIVVRPWINIQFMTLVSSRIGHYLESTELLISEIEVGVHDSGTKNKVLFHEFIPISARHPAICNKYLSKMWRRSICVVPYWIAEPTTHLLDLGSGRQHRPTTAVGEFVDVHNVFGQTSHHLQFTSNETATGLSFLRHCGLPEGAPYVCLHVRDSAFRGDYPWRNQDIADFVPAVQEMVERGYYVFRMGARVEQPFPWAHPNVIDYATRGLRTEFLDIFLSAHCKCWVSTGSGIDSAAWAFRKPILLVLKAFRQWPTAFDMVRNKGDALVLPSRVGCKGIDGTVETLPLSDVMSLLQRDGSIAWGTGEILEVESSPEEILVAVKELLARVEGSYVNCHRSDALQRMFWDLVPPSPDYDFSMTGPSKARICDSFLENNPQLF